MDRSSMAVSSAAASATEAPLLDDIVDGVVDYRGWRVSRLERGGWRSASFIIGVEMAERFALYGIASNLITYLTGPLGQSTAAAAENVNAWFGAVSMLPLLGAFVADSYLGRYRTIVFSSLLYVLGLGLLTASAVLQPQGSTDCLHSENDNSCSSSSSIRVIFFFFSLYLVAVAQSGHKPCVQAFGADQFDGSHSEESKSRSSFFNWWYFSVCFGTAFTICILCYIQDYLSWGLGFGIPCAAMVVALVVFLFGTRTYRYSFKEDKSNPFVRVAQVFVAAARNWRITPSSAIMLEEAGGTVPHVGAHKFNFLDKALAGVSDNIDGSRKGWKTCSISQVEEAKALLRLVPIWATCLIYAVVFSQSSTFFTKQGSTMDRSIGSNFQIPPATLQAFISISVVIFIPIYDRVFIPTARVITGKPSGINMLQRIGIGLFLSLISIVVAALVEMKRLQVVVDFGLVDKPTATIPMSLWWLVPQYVVFGISEAFTMVGLQEFFYDQVPDGLRSLGLSLYLSIFGVGSFLSSFLISVIEKATSGNGHTSWFSNNLNQAHLNYFYWLLAALSMIGLAAYLYFATSYTYNRESKHDEDLS